MDFDRFRVLTFDCYGTLVDWETGIVAGLRTALGPDAAAVSDDDLLERFGHHEAIAETGDYRSYREVLRRTLAGIAGDLRIEPSPASVEAFAGSVGDWPVFPDSAESLATLAERFRLGVITNCDDDLFDGSDRRLGSPFTWVITAQQVGSYKPSHRNFEVAIARIGVPRDRVLHVAQSLYHDHVPAKTLGFSTVWVDRRHGRTGSGATPPAEARPDLVVPDLRTLAGLTRGASRP
jgi:2-haloacid dehalogenase